MASYNSIICRYNEIATKGNNRSMFENTQIRNMKRMTKDRVPGLNYVKMADAFLSIKTNLMFLRMTNRTI